jgi:phage terminase large subunit-like protein
MSTVLSEQSWTSWPRSAKLKLLVALREERWRQNARPEQVAPLGDWRTWYLQGGRGAGKTRTGAETLAGWIHAYPPGDWAIVAPTYGAARDVCVEGRDSGLLAALSGLLEPGGWNRSMGSLELRSGAKVYVDGADDGALRIQGKNLCGVWADEVGLWKDWETAWHYSIAHAVRFEPGRIIATGTPKMGHGLVRLLIEDPKVPVSRMRTIDNIEHLSDVSVKQLMEMYAGTRIGRQELEGEWFAELEGDLLQRCWWQFYPPQAWKGSVYENETEAQFVARLPKFRTVVCSWDTPLKDKESADHIAGQCWGVLGADRFLLDARVDHAGYPAAREMIVNMSNRARRLWPNAQHRVLIENAGYGSELLLDLPRELSGVMKINPGPEGSKGMRAFTAAADLESGNCFLPGYPKPNHGGPDEMRTPPFALSLVDECASFRIDGTHTGHDDQVDAWSQAINWARRRAASPTMLTVAEGVA